MGEWWGQGQRKGPPREAGNSSVAPNVMAHPDGGRPETVEPPRDNVAVVAVHGIGQQRAGDSVRAIAAMLLRLQHPDGSARFSGFVETPLQIATRRVGVKPRVPSAAVRASRWREYSDALSAMLHSETGSRQYAAEYEFMRAQLEAYPGDDDPYVTTRIAGSRHAVGSTQSTSCMHIYEVFWENLSRVGSGPLPLLSAFYQLLFNTANLGQVAVNHAALRYRSMATWRTFRTLHALATRLFTMFVPASWALMLGTSLTLLILAIPDDNKILTVGWLAGIVTFAGLWRAYHAVRTTGWPWFSAPIASIAVTYVAARGVQALSALAVDRILVVLWSLIACGLVVALFHRYERVRPGAFLVGIWTSVAVFVGTVGWTLLATDVTWLFARVLEVFAVESALTVLLWYVIYALGFAAALIGAVARRGKSGDDTRVLRLTQWTATATLGTAASAVLVFTFVLWSAIMATTRSWLRPMDAEYFRITLPWFNLQQATKDDRVWVYLRAILESSGGAGYPLLLWCMLVVVLTALIAIGPSLARELLPSERASPQPMSAQARRDHAREADDATERLGRDLSDRMQLVSLAAVALFVFAFFAQPTVSITHWVQEANNTGGSVRAVLEWLHENGAQWIAWSGGLLGASGLGLYAWRERVGPVIDTALDVDNYLREHPRDATPRARIAERYVSLLRYLNAWRDDNGRPYDRVIIVAHSQGAVITADLLGFVKLEREMNDDLYPLLNGPIAGGADRRLHLFTMGSPLRQIYARAFPLLYEWMRGTHAPWGTSRMHAVGATTTVPPSTQPAVPTRLNDGHRVAGPGLSDDSAPHPADFGLWRWVNAYRSGDYVGRALWRDPTTHADVLYRRSPREPSTFAEDAPETIWVSEDTTGRRRELCIGSGAHTRYWDATAMPIAVELDLLIAAAPTPVCVS